MNKSILFLALVTIGIGAMEKEDSSKAITLEGSAKLTWIKSGDVANFLIQRGEHEVDLLAGTVLMGRWGGLYLSNDVEPSSLPKQIELEVKQLLTASKIMLKFIKKNNLKNSWGYGAIMESWGKKEDLRHQSYEQYSNGTSKYEGPKEMEKEFTQNSITIFDQIKSFQQHQQELEKQEQDDKK